MAIMDNARFLLQNYGDKSTLFSYISGTNEILFNNIEVGNVTDTGVLDYTNFTFNTLVQGDTSTQESSQIFTRADVSGDLWRTWFSIHTPGIHPQYYYVWYNNGGGLEPDHGIGPVGIEVLYENDDNANIIAYKTILAMSNIDDISIYNGAISTLPVENLQHISKSRVLRTEGSEDLEVFGTLYNPYEISAMVLARHNFPLFTRYRLRLYSDDVGSGSNLLYDSFNVLIEEGEIGTNLSGWGEFVWGNGTVWGGDEANDPADVEFTPAPNLTHWLDQTVTDVQSYKINISKTGTIGEYDPMYVNRTDIDCHVSIVDCHDTGLSGEETLVNRTDLISNDIVVEANDTGDLSTIPDATTQYFQVSRLFLGKYIDIPYNIELGHSLSWVEDTKQFRSDGGTLRSNIEVPYRQLEFNLAAVPENNRAEIQHGFRNVGLRRDFFISLFPNNTSIDKEIDYSSIVKLKKIPKYTEFANNYYTSKYIMEEV